MCRLIRRLARAALLLTIIVCALFFVVIRPIALSFACLGRPADWPSLGGLGSYLQGACSLLSLAGIIYVAIQVELMKKQGIIAAYERMIEFMHEVDSHFLEYPCLAPYFYAGEEIPIRASTETRERARAIADMFLDLMDLYTVLKENAPRDPDLLELWGKWRSFFVHRIRTSPTIRERFRLTSLVGYYSHLQPLFDEANTIKPKVVKACHR